MNPLYPGLPVQHTAQIKRYKFHPVAIIARGRATHFSVHEPIQACLVRTFPTPDPENHIYMRKLESTAGQCPGRIIPFPRSCTGRTGMRIDNM